MLLSRISISRRAHFLAVDAQLGFSSYFDQRANNQSDLCQTDPCLIWPKPCKGDFEDVSTLNGRCRRFCPKEQMMETARYSSFARQATISMIISFNESDWTSGWNHLLVGATMYLLPSYENTLGWLSYRRTTLKRI